MFDDWAPIVTVIIVSMLVGWFIAEAITDPTSETNTTSVSKITSTVEVREITTDSGTQCVIVKYRAYNIAISCNWVNQN